MHRAQDIGEDVTVHRPLVPRSCCSYNPARTKAYVTSRATPELRVFDVSEFPYRHKSDAPGTTRAYAHYMAGAFVLLVLFAMARHVLSATGRSRFAVVSIAAALPANAVLNHLFMAGAFDIEGIVAGLASLVVAMGLGGSATAYLFLSRSFDGFRDPTRTERVLAPRELLRLTRPTALIGLGAVAETGVVLVSTLIVGLIAPDILIAHTLAFRAMAAC